MVSSLTQLIVGIGFGGEFVLSYEYTRKGKIRAGRGKKEIYQSEESKMDELWGVVSLCRVNGVVECIGD